MTIPPYLKPGDTIGLICPAGYMPAEKVQACVQTLKDWGYEVRVGATVGSNSTNYFSGTDEERRNELQQMLDDDTIHAIMCARGGYGLGRIIDDLNFKKFRDSPKWLIGFSDITILLSHVFSRYSIASVHAPMAAAFNDGEHSNEYINSLRQVLSGAPITYEVAPHEYNRRGKASGILIGGNPTLLSHMIGTASDISTKGKILFLEDVGEYLYNIDRMMYQLKRSGKFEKLNGLIVGGFTDVKDTERHFGESAYEIIRDVTEGYDFPVCYNFPVSHEKENYALKVGMKYHLDVGEKVRLIDHYA